MNISKLFKIHQLFKREGIALDKLMFGEIKTADGQAVITYQGEDIVVGEPVMVVTDEGEIPAPDGKHILEDGRTIVVEGGMGVVSEIIEGEVEVEVENPEVPAEVPAPTAPELAAEPSAPMSKEEITRTINETVRKFEEEANAKIVELENKFKAETEKYEQVIDGIYQLYKKMSDAPAASPAQPVKKFNSQKAEFDAMWNKINKRK